MSEKKNLSIHVANCDLRSVSEETLERYHKIDILAAQVLMTTRTQELLARYQVSIQASSIEKVEEDEQYVMHNGIYHLTGNEAGNGKVRLQINGKLYVEKGAEETLKNYRSIQVNGKAVYPESLGSALAGILTCNGKVLTYPDDAILVEKILEANRVFAARAKQGARYFCIKEVWMTGGKEELARLIEKEVKIRAPKAVVVESLLDAAVEVLEEDVDIVLVPDGCVCINDDVCVDGHLSARYGKKLLVLGSAEIRDGKALEELEFFQVEGKVFVSEKDEEIFHRVCKKSGGVTVYKGRLIRGESELLVDRKLLQEAGTVTAAECAEVQISPELTEEELRDRIFIRSCSEVQSTEAVRGILRLQSQQVSGFEDLEKEEAEEEEGACEEETETEGNTIYVNAVSYTM